MTLCGRVVPGSASIGVRVRSGASEEEGMDGIGAALPRGEAKRSDSPCIYVRDGTGSKDDGYRVVVADPACTRQARDQIRTDARRQGKRKCKCVAESQVGLR